MPELTTSDVIETVTFTDHDGTERRALQATLEDGGDSPNSRYGETVDEWAPVAVGYYLILVHHHAETSAGMLDEAVALTVNDSPAVGAAILADGSTVGIDPADLLRQEVRDELPF